MQEARAAHSSNLVSKSRDNPKVLFDMVSDIVTSAPPVISIFFKEDQENVPSFFVEKKEQCQQKNRFSAWLVILERLQSVSIIFLT